MWNFGIFDPSLNIDNTGLYQSNCTLLSGPFIGTSDFFDRWTEIGWARGFDYMLDIQPL